MMPILDHPVVCSVSALVDCVISVCAE